MELRACSQWRPAQDEDGNTLAAEKDVEGNEINRHTYESA
jgi:hypothetical protein